jgi:hypothetical protein
MGVFCGEDTLREVRCSLEGVTKDTLRELVEGRSESEDMRGLGKLDGPAVVTPMKPSGTW